jgi:hypothetical protein
MPGLDPGIHQLEKNLAKKMDGRVKPGHDELRAQMRFVKHCWVGKAKRAHRYRC